jgi:hypothetical protein
MLPDVLLPKTDGSDVPTPDEESVVFRWQMMLLSDDLICVGMIV